MAKKDNKINFQEKVKTFQEYLGDIFGTKSEKETAPVSKEEAESIYENARSLLDYKDEDIAVELKHVKRHILKRIKR